MSERALKFDGVLTASGWLDAAIVVVDQDGMIQAIKSGEVEHDITEKIPGYLIPGFRNAHSHAFQYAMVGTAEHLSPNAAQDDFWSWRDGMYRLANALEPESMQGVATHLYRQLRAMGYCRVAEFHYVHHQPDGSRYDDRGEMCGRLMAAAKEADIGLTLIPVFYSQGDFGKVASQQQRRFCFSDVDEYARLVARCDDLAKDFPLVKVGMGLHSLRAADEEQTKALFELWDCQRPFHLHIAEQQREVDSCIEHYGAPPIRWLLDQCEVGEGCHFVHATHAGEDELAGMAQRGVTAVLCPSTEANLGDGVFGLRSFVRGGGRIAIGTDSHIGLFPLEELRLLDYGQRLWHQQRNVLCQPGEDSGDQLIWRSLHGGVAACGETGSGMLQVGQPLNGAVLDANDPKLVGVGANFRLSSAIFSGERPMILGAFVAGRYQTAELNEVDTAFVDVRRRFFAND